MTQIRKIKADILFYMKIISLNTWGGRVGKEGLINFFSEYKNKNDIFCLQEIWSAPYDHLEGQILGGVETKHNNIMVYGKQEIEKMMSDYTSFFRPHHLNNYGLLMLVHKDYEIIKEGELFVHKEKDFIPEGDVGHHARNIQYISLFCHEKVVTVINFHGLWNGEGKKDSTDRLKQSENIVAFIQSLEGEVILMGDFNLSPETESLLMFEKAGLVNLIKEYGISSTRTSFYTKPEKFADYVFVSKGLHVKDFKVLPDEVSDHSPLSLEIN